MKLGVNPDDFVFRRVRDVDIWDYVAVPLDMVYNRLFTLTSRNYQDIIDKLEQPRDDTYLRINNSLKRNKDLSFVGGVLMSLVAFWCFMRGRFSTFLCSNLFGSSLALRCSPARPAVANMCCQT